MKNSLEWLITRTERSLNANVEQINFSSLVIYLYRLQRAISDHIRPVIRKHNLSQIEFEILQAISLSDDNWELTISDINDLCLISTGGITKAVRRLVERKLIQVRPHPSDQRAKQCRLSRKGRLAINAALDEVRDAEMEIITRCIPAEKRRQFVSQLSQVAKEIDLAVYRDLS